MTKGKNQDEFFDDADYGSEEGEDFPEPAQPAKPKPNVALFAGAALGAIALGLGGFYVAAPETLRDMLPADMVAMMPEGTFPAAEPEATPEPVRPRKHHKAHQEAAPAAKAPVKKAPAADQTASDQVPADSAEWQKPADQANQPATHVKKPAQAIAKPAAHAAQKPAEPVAKAPAAAQPVKAAAKPVEKPKPVEAAAKPVEKPKAVKMAAKTGRAMATTAISFAPHSSWVAAAEVEKLWAISARAGGQTGHFVITTHAGRSSDEGEVLGKRAEKLAEMIRRNHAVSSEVSIRSGSPAQNSTGWVDVSFVKRL